MPLKLGVDVGGTFTDLLLFDEDTGRQVRAKTPSTPPDPSVGVLAGIDKVCRLADVSPGAITHIMHGTTVATNAVLEGKGAKVGLITTEGFKQILHLARSWTPGPLAGWIIMVKPDPPAALEHTREAKERIDTRGNIVIPLDEERLRQTLQDLASRGIEALTVALINSYANPVHEKRIKAIAQEMFPTLPVTASAEVLPEFREYERALTAVMNSYVRPKVALYMRNFADRLTAHGLNAEVNILRSDAGLMTLSMAQERPVYGVMSGPAGGVAGALFIATKAGFPNILTIDMGGTSTDVSLCQDGMQTITRETTLGYFPIKVPSVDVRSIGAGGGSIAHVPEITNALRVGPQSAGADPGPACYGKGGAEATVTDANVVLGHLPPRLLGGEMVLDEEAAKAAVERIGRKLGLDVYHAAQGILDIVNENMHGALRLVSVQRGYDPRNFALVAFGGAGPLHANAVANLIGSFPVIVPPAPGILCATGDVCCDYREEFARTVLRTLEQISVAEVTKIFENLGEEAAGWLEREGIPRDQQQIFYNADMRYFRQGYELPLTTTLNELQTQGTVALANRFHALHEQHDEFPMICDPNGRMVVGQFGSYIREMMERFDRPLYPGDVLLLNDPYLCGGAISHINDFLVLVPVFDGDELIGWCSMFGHQMDVGGPLPGSFPTNATSIFGEGLRIPPVKLFEKGGLNQDVLDLILNNVRIPVMNRSDLMGIVAGCKTAEQRVLELCRRFGRDTYLAACQALLDRTYRAVKTLIQRNISTEPQSFEDYVDDDGLGNGPFKMKLTIWREEDKAVFDWTGTDPQAMGPINFYLNEGMFKMFIGVYLIMVYDPQILFNDGFYDLIAARIPDGSLLHPRFPAALGCRTHALARLFDVMSSCLGQKSPELTTAAGYGTSPHLLYSGTDKNGQFFFIMEISYGGIPGRPIGDGMDGHSWWPLFTNIPTEYLESYCPLRVDRYASVIDSGGAGLHRGGNGIDKWYTFLESGEIAIHDDRWLTPPWGILGGTPGLRSTKILVRANGTRTVLPSKCDQIKVEPGDQLIYQTAGGGGWGDPLQRDAEKVRIDVARELVSLEKAQRNYGVVIDLQTIQVDDAATRALREQMAKERGAVKTFDFGPPLHELLAHCKEETGLEPPVAPKLPAHLSNQRSEERSGVVPLRLM